MPDPTAEQIAAIVRDLGPVERRVVRLIAQRILGGQLQYGLLDPHTDRRDFAREEGEEVADAIVYRAIIETYRRELGDDTADETRRGTT
jgi:hypothetical protein